MQLKTLLQPFMPVSWLKHNPEIGGLTHDSRVIKAGDLFIAYPGHRVDGRHFIPFAIEKKCAAILYDPQDHFTIKDSPIPTLPINHLFQKMGGIAARFYGYPSEQLVIIGITGTNGKTTIAYQLADLYTVLGLSTAYIGTLGYGIPPHLQSLLNTTPDGLYLQQLFVHFLKTGVKQVCMEVSSHALAEKRVNGVTFKHAIFTNLTPEHLDFHKTMTAYRAAKGKLFAMPSLNTAVLNGDDPNSTYMISKLKHSVFKIKYGLKAHHEVWANHCHYTLQGTTFELISPYGYGKCFIPLIGAFNLYNALAIASSLFLSHYDFKMVQHALSTLIPVTGRLEVLMQHPYVIVDFAHTPDALEKLLSTLRLLHAGQLKIIFGCGGDRDTFKRPMMGKIASQYADELILTNDNPRFEDPLTILKHIQAGILPGKSVVVIPDRREAILYGLKHAKKSEMIVISGKGHEMYQEIQGVRTAFSDQVVVLEVCKEK